jgi:uncharacterized membrane protein
MAARPTIGNTVAPPSFILFFCLLIAGMAIGWQYLDKPSAVMIGFDLAAIGFMLSVVRLVGHKAPEMREAARQNDANRLILLGTALVLSFVILVAVAGELTGDRHLSQVQTALVIVTLALAWTFANLVYALHYAHLYYSGNDDGTDDGGLDFPGDHPEPDYWDFIYFSFTLGVALQTSDVMITSSSMRRLVLGQCIQAFVYNLVVLALAVNVLAS